MTDSKAIEENSLHTSVKDFFWVFFPFFFSNGSGREKSGREAERKCVKQSEPAVTKPQLEETTGKCAAVTEGYSHNSLHIHTGTTTQFDIIES